MMAPPQLRIAVIGHVEHVVIARVPALPAPGDILHLDDPSWIAGGGGGITFAQLSHSPAELHLFTAFGNDDAAALVRREVDRSGAVIHAGRREAPQTRDIALLTTGGERTIIVIGPPLHAAITDPLDWAVLDRCDAVFFTGQDPDVLRRARNARVLVVTARRQAALAESGISADVVVGSASDPREASTLADYRVRPRALVMTEGGAGGYVETASGILRFTAPNLPAPPVGRYGAGDAFAGALTWFLACGIEIQDACTRAAVFGAAVLRGFNPLEHQLPLDDPREKSAH